MAREGRLQSFPAVSLYHSHINGPVRQLPPPGVCSFQAGAGAQDVVSVESSFCCSPPHTSWDIPL